MVIGNRKEIPSRAMVIDKQKKKNSSRKIDIGEQKKGFVTNTNY